MKKNNMTKKCFGLSKKTFFKGLIILSSAIPLNATLLKCISATNQERKVRTEIVNVNSNDPVFCLFSINTSKCCSS